MSRPDRASFPVVVHGMLTREATVFMLRRAKTGFMDGYYTLPGGHIDQGESVVEALVRECREEAGVEVINPQPCCVLPYISGRHQGFNFVFTCADFSGEPEIAEPELFDQSAWFPLRALPDPSPPWLTDVVSLEATGEWFRELRWD